MLLTYSHIKDRNWFIRLEMFTGSNDDVDRLHVVNLKMSLVQKLEGRLRRDQTLISVKNSSRTRNENGLGLFIFHTADQMNGNAFLKGERCNK